MTNPISLTTADLSQKPKLPPGTHIRLSGPVYTARDAAHKRLCKSIKAGDPLPFNLNEAVIYYAGPAVARPGAVIGSCGPTTSARMDGFAPILYDMGVIATIGKGTRSPGTRDAIQRNNAFYFRAVGGAGALAAKHITSLKVIAYEDLGCESIKKLTFENFPLIVS